MDKAVKYRRKSRQIILGMSVMSGGRVIRPEVIEVVTVWCKVGTFSNDSIWTKYISKGMISLGFKLFALVKID